MPTAAPKPCAHPGCKCLVRDGSGQCDKHRREQKAAIDSRRGSSTERGYNSRWQKARATVLRRDPLCRMCAADGKTTPATVIDHIIPHRGDQALFWDTSNWQPLCKRCHDSKKQKEERQLLKG